MVEFPSARLNDFHVCPMFTGIVPHVGGPILPPTLMTVLVGSLPAARLADMVTCSGPPDVIVKGAATVLIGGLPAARMTDQTVHGGTILLGCFTVLIGDPAFALPANVTISPTAPPDFQNKTIRDLYFLSTTPSGQAILAGLAASGQPVTIVPCPDPANSFCTPNSSGDAGNGTGTGSTIQYNPDIKLNGYDAAGNQISEPPQVVLGHEMCHALANANGTQQSGTDPSPPASQPNIEGEEAQAIGTGSHNAQNPSENTLRSDMGLPRRDNHFGGPPPASGGPPAQNFRPGGY